MVRCEQTAFLLVPYKFLHNISISTRNPVLFDFWTGYALCAVLSAIQEKYGEGNEQRDILSDFDLMAGTSVGGCCAVTLHFMKNL